jgi:hypothetical protein
MASSIARGFASSQQPFFEIGSTLCDAALSMTALLSVVRFVSWWCRHISWSDDPSVQLDDSN